MDKAEPHTPPVPAWAEALLRRESARSSAHPTRWSMSPSVDHPTAWLDEDWQDLAQNVAGHTLSREAAGWRHVGEDDTSWRAGADGENDVAEELARLTQPRRRRWLSRAPAAPPLWRVLHNVKVGAAAITDIDHVLIGPPGIAIINTKNLNPRYRVHVHQGQVHHGRSPTNYLEQLDREVGRASSLIATALEAILSRLKSNSAPADLPASVIELARTAPKASIKGATWPCIIPALVFVGTGAVEEHFSLPILARPATFVRAVTDRPTALSQTQIDGFFQLCRRSTTWTRDAGRYGP